MTLQEENQKLRELLTTIRVAINLDDTEYGLSKQEKILMVDEINAALAQGAEPCGGCGNADESKRCIGCGHHHLAAPVAQTAPQPEPSGLSLPRTRLERIERRLTDWLDLNCCECESGHSCGRNEVTADRDAIRAALSAPIAQTAQEK